MIIDQKKTTLAYRCPACGGVPTSMVGAFSLSADLFKLKCPCQGSELTVYRTNDNKLRITVPCLACTTPHTYTISKNVFFNSDVFIIPCSLSGIDICFIGTEENVKKAVEKSNNELMELLGNISCTDINPNRKKEKAELTDPQVLDIITYVVHELNDEGKIYCRCNEGEGDYECNIYDDFITVKCKKCKASATIPADSLMKAHEFLHTDSLTLK
jgi:hypothetical protein